MRRATSKSNSPALRLTDVHVHFWGDTLESAEGRRWDENMLYYARQWGIAEMWASCLGTWGVRTPTYMSDYTDMVRGNDSIHRLTREHPGVVLGYCVVNPIYGDRALAEMKRCFEELGFVGLKLAAAVRVTRREIDPVIARAIDYDVPILQHVRQHRDGDLPNTDISDAMDLADLAARFPEAKIIAAHISGGGDWEYGIRAYRRHENIFVDISGSGTDSGMMEYAVDQIGADRLVFGTDLTTDTGLAKLAALPLTDADREKVAWRNAERLKSMKL